MEFSTLDLAACPVRFLWYDSGRAWAGCLFAAWMTAMTVAGSIGIARDRNGR